MFEEGCIIVFERMRVKGDAVRHLFTGTQQLGFRPRLVGGTDREDESRC